MTTPKRYQSRHGPITKKEARRLAEQATRYGYSKRSETEADTRCPVCEETVTAYKLAWERFTAAKWDAAFHRHLTDWAIDHAPDPKGIDPLGTTEPDPGKRGEHGGPRGPIGVSA